MGLCSANAWRPLYQKTKDVVGEEMGFPIRAEAVVE